METKRQMLCHDLYNGEYHGLPITPSGNFLEAEMRGRHNGQKDKMHSPIQSQAKMQKHILPSMP